MRPLASKFGVNTKKHTQAKLWQRIATLLTAFVLMGSALAQIAQAAPGDYAWQKAGTNLSGDQSYWQSIASSSDGSKLAAVVYSGSLYTSSDSGATWTEQTAAGSRNWYSIASSSDGTKLTAVVYSGSLYTSSDSGATWTEQTAAGSRDWSSIASSSDGTKLAAVESTWNGTSSVGSVYTSSDSGATWTERTTAGSRSWSSIASSSDGTKLAAVVSYGSVYTSSDSGATWKQETPPSRSWVSVAMSTDGSRLAVAAEAGNIYLASKEGPATATVAMPSLPAGSKDVTAAPAIAGASLSATSMSCYTLTPGTTTTYGPDSLTVPEQGVNLLGGIGFTLTCTDTGGTANTAITLGTAYSDVSALRVYKRSGTGPLVDITEQVTIQNETVAGATKTVIRYNLVDGGSLDEDGTADGTITDPIYIGVVNGAATTTPGAAGGSLANTGSNVYVLLALAATLLISATATGVKALRYQNTYRLDK
ncbi:MAG: sialidase family protein [Candidatus Saccharimonadales bacterium]